MDSPGRILTLIGADGAGKSTQARRMCASLRGSARCVYMGSNPSAFTHALPTTRAWIRIKRGLGRTVHHPGPPEVRSTLPPAGPVQRGARNVKSLAVLGLRVSEDLYRLLLAAIYARSGTTVLLDRHPYADYYARRVQHTDRWLPLGERIHGFLLRHVYPRPTNLVLLDAPAEVLHSRKPEGSLVALQARRQEYLDLIRSLPEASVTVIDASRSEESVLDDLMKLAGPHPPLTEPHG